MQAQPGESVYWPGIDADIADYVSWCIICTKHKASPPSQPMLPRDIPDGPWQDITADCMTHKGHEYLNHMQCLQQVPLCVQGHLQISPIPMHVSAGAHFSVRTLNVTVHWNGPLFASDKLAELLTCHCIAHHTSSPHFQRSNGFIERQVRTIKTSLNTALPANKPLHQFCWISDPLHWAKHASTTWDPS